MHSATFVASTDRNTENRKKIILREVSLSCLFWNGASKQSQFLGWQSLNFGLERAENRDVMAHWLSRLLSTGGSWARLPLWPSRRDLGQVLYLQLPVRFGVKLRYSIRAVVGSASEW